MVAQTIATSGKLNNLAINADTRLLVITAASGISGIAGLATGRELVIENRTGGALTLHENDTDSTDINRFAFAGSIPAGACQKVIYTNGRLRQVL